MTAISANEETKTLLASLNAQRQHALGILEGLDDQALRRPVLPSGWTCLGLLQHLALDIERFWFREVVAGEPIVASERPSAPNAWTVAPDVPVASIFDQYRREIDRANAILAVTSLDAPPVWWPAERFGGWRLQRVREIALHVIAETACHAGHLDAVRELIDGRRWLVLPD